MKKSFQIGGAFVGLVTGAGFASGQEIMQYFTSFGVMGILGGLVATVVFAFLGMILAQLGSDLQTTSHKEGIYHIGGRFFGPVLDMLIIAVLFGVAVVMFAGSGATFQQTFGIHPMIGSIIMVIVTILTLLLDVKNILKVVAMLTPYLMGIIFVIMVYSFFTMDYSVGELDIISREQPAAASSWWMGAILYVSYNIAAGAAMLIVMGGTEKDRKIAGRGGIIGGIMLGVLIVLINLALFVKMDVVAGTAMPTLELAKQIHPAVGICMALILLGMMYVFTVRFISPDKPMFKPVIVLVGFIGFAASTVGFTTLVGKMYAAMGYLGFALVLAIILAWAFKGDAAGRR